MSTDSQMRTSAATVVQLPADVRELYPFESRWLAVSGGRMHYVDERPRDLPTVDQMPPDTTAAMPQAATADLPQPAAMDLPQPTAVDLPQPAAVDLPHGTTTGTEPDASPSADTQPDTSAGTEPDASPSADTQPNTNAGVEPDASSNAVAQPDTSLNAGTGLPPVLLLHGNPTWSFFYRDVILKLVVNGRRCIAPDHIGCGLSDKPQKNFGYTLEENISNVITLIEHLGLKQFDLVVHDWGGAIGMGVATRMPERVRRIVILNTAAYRSKTIPLRIALCRVPLLGALIVRGFNGFAWPATFMAVNRKPLGETQKRGFLFPYGNWHDRIATHRFVKAIPLRPSDTNYDTLAAIEDNLHLLNQKPKLLLWGGRDFCFNDHFYQRWLEIFPDVRQRYISDAGHYLLEDAPRETIGEIDAFLQQQ